MLGFQTLRAEFRPTFRLATPLVLAELGWMSMAIVDTMMLGRLPNSATAIAAVSLGGILVHVLASSAVDFSSVWTRLCRKPLAQANVRIATAHLSMAFISAWL